MRDGAGLELAELVAKICKHGIEGDGINGSEVIAIKIEYDEDLSSVGVYRVTKSRFGDRTGVVELVGGEADLDGGGIVDQVRRASDVERLKSWATEAWNLARGCCAAVRGFFGAHDSIFMMDLDTGVERVVDFDKPLE